MIVSSFKEYKGLRGQGHMQWDEVYPFRITLMAVMDGKLNWGPFVGATAFKWRNFAFTYLHIYLYIDFLYTILCLLTFSFSVKYNTQ